MTRQTTGAGHTTVRQKALITACSALCAEALGVSREKVATSLFDDDGKLGIAVNVSYPLPQLDRLDEHKTYLSALGGTIFDAVSRARSQIVARASYLTSAEVGSVNVTLDGIVPPSKGVRVQ
ncbi:hypothetical protein ACFP6B_01260 [Rothia nasimurium]|uniref:hypothetical protein n=1 Tax=Rothia nasimurium TaxID=85336 RepID=UPI0036176E08